MIRRIPKRGFNNARFKTQYAILNLTALNQFDDGARVDDAALRSLGLVKGKVDGIKILGNGELKKKLTIIAHAFSASARKAVEGLGGICELIIKPPFVKGVKTLKAKSAKS